MTKIAINGFGRIGRLLFRQLVAEKGVAVVAINDLASPENLVYLLKYDSVYGRFSGSVELKDGVLVVEGKEIAILQEKDPSKLPWAKLGVDVVVEATGAFTSYSQAKAHIEQAGAKRVVITAPSKEEDSAEGKTVLMGVNEEALSTCLVSSNGSCTTNAAGPLMQILSENPGILKAQLSSVHGYTASQSLVDGPSKKDPRRGRAGAYNIVPSSTGAAVAVSRALPELKGKFDGLAFRVPVIAGSVADITFVAKRKTSREEVNDILKKAAENPRWKGVFTVTEEPIVSSDIIREPFGAIADLSFTKVVDGDLVKVLSWYDNEWGYVATLRQHVLAAAKTIK
ncbi:MAG: type I glyceraldehyde-3-phosphate dehydrogenase [bacterium]|nr:type I glyceraldehyde-3-phosphate dehydrogenase [bacterium]